MRRFIKHQRRLNRCQVFQMCSSRVGSRGKKTGEEELIRWQPGGDKCCHESRGTRDWNQRNAPLDSCVHDAKSRVANQRCAGIRYNGDVLSALKKFAQLYRSLSFVVFVITNGAGLNTEVIQ